MREKARYRIQNRLLSRWYVHSFFAYGDVPDPLKTYCGKDCVEIFIENIENEVKRLYGTLLRKPTKEFINLFKKKHKATEKCDYQI